MSERPVPDAHQRTEALDPQRSFIVQAPAGSGKTELLIQRYLRLLATVEAPEEIAAITFTRKAAGEMRERVLEALRAGRGPEPVRSHAALTWRLAREAIARDAGRGWRIEDNPARLRIQTIDALCASLTRQMPVLSRFGAPPAVVEDAAELRREAARQTLALLERDDAHALPIARLLTHLDNDAAVAETLLASMLAHRDQWIRHLSGGAGSPDRERLEAALQRARIEGLERARALAPEALEAELCALLGYAAENLAAANAASPLLACADLTGYPAAQEAALPAWLGLAELLLTQKGEWRKSVRESEGFPAPGNARDKGEKERLKAAKERMGAALNALAGHEAFRIALGDLRALPPPRYSEGQWEALGAIARLLPLAVAQLQLTFQSRGETDFTEVAQAALRALGEEDAPTDLALALDYRIRHLLVDEFQDTSLSQFELLKKLTAGWEPGDGRTLFAVGDPMQSIYRFREAEVGLFLQARREGIGHLRLEPLTLCTNFRSTGAVVQWVNAAFRQVLPEAEDVAGGAVPYSPSQAFDGGGDGTAVTVHPQLGADRTAEAARVVDLVRAAHREDPRRSVAILVRSRGHLARIVPALKEAGLRFRAIEIEPLGSRPVVQDLFALTRAIVHPGDRLAWLAVLRAPWCGLTLADLEVLAGNGLPETPPPPGDGSIVSSLTSTGDEGDEKAAVLPSPPGGGAGERAGGRGETLPSPSGRGAGGEGSSGDPWTPGASRRTIQELMLNPDRVARLSDDGRRRLHRVRDVLGDALDNRRRGSLRERVETAWLALGGPACVEDATDLEDADVYLDYLEALERAGDAPDPAALAEGLARLYALPDVHAGEGLQIMTIHKAKGLEFDTVIVPGLGFKPAQQERRLMQWMARPRPGGGSDLLLAPIKETGADQDPIYSYIANLDREKALFEAGRLLYVAATRARRRLHLLGHAAVKAKDGAWQLREPESATLLARLWPAVEAEYRRAADALPPAGSGEAPPGEGDVEAAASDRPAISQATRRLAPDWTLPEPPPAVAWQREEPAHGEAQVEFSWAGEAARHVGTVVHRWLQKMGEDALQGWDHARIEKLQPVCRSQLLRLGVRKEELDAAVTKALAALQRAASDERGRWLLGPHPQARCEYRLTGVLDGELIDVVIDRTFMDRDGVRWIVDYKTGTHEGGDVDQFLDREQKRYAAQLERYARLLSAADPAPVRRGLYFPLLGGWREW